MHTIVTHPGSAHKDDFLSACVLLASLDNPGLQRREPTPADLEDPDTYVVDVGMVHDPLRHNFDHHQDQQLPCAFHLIMQHLGYHDAAMQAYTWYPHMSMIDVFGPHRTAEQLGIDSSVLFATASPVEGYLLSIFAEVETLRRRELLYRFMQDFGRDILGLIDRKMQRLQLLKERAQVLPVRQFKAVCSDIRDTPKLALELYLKHLDDPQVAICVTPSNRGTGWELLRLGDTTMIDFRKIETHPEIRFVHHSGFLAKTQTLLPWPEVIRLTDQAISDH